MIAKRLRESLDSSICIRDIFEEGKKLAEVYGAEIFTISVSAIRVWSHQLLSIRQ